ncbi:uncharacterized protein [Hetaerina americana]|uniref:uncharacterized protein n=1 Tax=Hetaerina americana TaxID=62018 RepID=UPI003A7F5072
MWKCFNRGVWETIDRSVNLFKADTSNGTCLISSLAKDLDGLNDESTRSKPKECFEDKSAKSHISEERSVPCERKKRRPVNGTVKIQCDHSSASKVFSRDLRHARPLETTQIFDKTPAYSINDDVNANHLKDCHPPPGIIYSCTGRTINGKCEIECSCDARSFPDSDYISESQVPDEGRVWSFGKSRESNIKWKLQLQSQSKSRETVGFPEERRGFYLSFSKQNEPSLTKSKFCSSVKRIISLRDDQSVKEKSVALPQKNNQPYDLIHLTPHGKSNCMLKLPFHCNWFGGFTGLKNVSTYWLIKPNCEFGGGDSGGTDREKSGESEETKEDAWRECQMHQSLLEAIRWSSAVLLGWFLGQVRFWHTHGGEQRDRALQNRSKCCIPDSLAKLLVTWQSDTTLPLKVLPSKSNGLPKSHKEKEVSEVQGGEMPLIDEACSEFFPHPLLLLQSEENNLYNRHSLSNDLVLEKAESINCHESHSKQQPSETHKNDVIPMQWHVNSAENVAYGPITFEEAVKEAGKELEEAQAEVLLTLALKKLNEDCSDAQNELPADLFQSAASLGSSVAAFNLGICYEKGVGGVDKNLTQAYHWYKQASEQGHPAATYNLAVFHANGLGGLHPNTFQANQLLLKASSLGLEEATKALGFLSSLNSVEKQCYNEEPSSLENNAYLCKAVGCENFGSSNSLATRALPKAVSSKRVKKRQGAVGMYSESCHGNNVDQSLSFVNVGAVSKTSEYFKETPNLSSLKIGDLLLPRGINLNKSADTARPLLEEIMFDDHPCMKSTHADNSSVQLLAH